MNLLNMDLRQRRPPYGYKSSFWPPAEIIMTIIIVVRARNYNNNNRCSVKLEVLPPAFPRFIVYGLEATPSILCLQIVFLAARRDDYGYCGGAHQEL